MKLLDLLVKELPKSGGWPKDAVNAIYFSHKKGATFYDKDDMGLKSGLSFICMDIPGVRREEVTKEEFEAALTASEGWIEWSGGECPVEYGTMVDIRDGDGSEWYGVDATPSTEYSDACGTFWEHKGSPENNIIAYRLHKPDINSRANDDRLERDLNECIGQEIPPVEWSNGGLPLVGVNCEMADEDGKYKPVEIIAWRNKCVIGWDSERLITYISHNPRDFRSLRTEAEKGREKLAASLHIAAGASPIELNGIGPLYFELADAIISGSVFGTTFKADK